MTLVVLVMKVILLVKWIFELKGFSAFSSYGKSEKDLHTNPHFLKRQVKSSNLCLDL